MHTYSLCSYTLNNFIYFYYIKNLEMKIQGILLLLFLWVINAPSYAQDNQEPQMDFEKYEDSLIVYADSIRFAILPIDKAEFNEKFSVMLKRVLEHPQATKHPFTRLRNHIHIIEPDDKSFRIFNWLIVVSEFQRKYYGVVQMMKTPKPTLYPLIDKSTYLEDNGHALNVVSNKEWYGCEFYNIKTLKLKNGTTIYALFGYNNNAIQSRKKILDHMYFSENGPMFGLPIIQTPQGAVINRLIVEYKKEAHVSLNYNDDEKRIIFDRTTSEIGDPKKRYTYVPTGHLDGFEWRNDMWMFVEEAVKVLKLQDGQAPIDGVFPTR